MNDSDGTKITNQWILSHRGKKNQVDPFKPYAWLVEQEPTSDGKVEDVATIFLTNHECPYHCLMCDLWKNTTDNPVPPGAIPSQIVFALNLISKADHIKLYNSGSFFDTNAIPIEDYATIASLVRGFRTVTVESHPRLIDRKCLYFRDLIKTNLQVAIGLESVNTDILRRLNKKMTLKDFTNSVGFLTNNQINTRAFILLRPPFMSESEGIYWAERSIDFAFEEGVECCVIIPVRSGNGAMDMLMENGLFTPPDIHSLEKVLEYGINLKAGRVFADNWDLQLFSKCNKCAEKRIRRINEMNLKQKILPGIECECN